MSDPGATLRSPIPIGEIAAPPFARLPEPETHFRLRAQRFAILSQGHDLEPYLRFMAGLAEAQHRCQPGLPDPALPSPDLQERARAHDMPPIDRSAVASDATLAATLDALFDLAPQIEMPDAARAALARATGMDAAQRALMIRDALTGSTAIESLAEHVFFAAAIQVHLARAASRLDAARLVPVGEGACPSCGAPPVGSMVVGWQGASNTRFCACSLCATLWHVVRVKCTLCGSTKGVSYQEIDGGPGAGVISAETCESCHAYTKVFQQRKDVALDPVADDVASLGLDLLVREAGYRRGAVNPFLLGY